ncbi:MAG TPA: transcription antitermination factor NusB [Acidimicrobiales bacterium]|nr:transcription antitermination factor NusB [Acidimicrobiales bacterium]
MPAGGRRAARERALSLLYEAEMKDLSPRAVLEQLPTTPDPYVTDRVAGVGDCVDELDKRLGELSVDWPVDRMPAIDRNILRLGAFELLRRPDVPVAVAIAEAVELAKQLSTEESGRFVNGVLAALAAAEGRGAARLDT